MLLRLAVRLKGVWSESRKFFHGTKRSSGNLVLIPDAERVFKIKNTPKGVLRCSIKILCYLCI